MEGGLLLLPKKLHRMIWNNDGPFSTLLCIDDMTGRSVI